LSTTRRTVRFAAETERSGAIPVGLANLLRAIRIAEDPAQLNLTTVVDVPVGVDVDRILDVVRDLLVRHESLRTTYPLTEGAGAEPVQHVHGAGELLVDVHDVSPRDDAAALAAKIGRELRASAFDLVTELPVRVAVVARAGVPVHAVVVLCHSAADATAWELLLREWHTLMAGMPLRRGHEPQPVDLVAIEQRGSVRRLMASALRHWDTHLRTVPQAMFTAPFMEDGRRVWPGLRVRSAAAADAVTRITERTGAGGSAVVLATLALLVGRHAGLPQCQVTALSANRVLPDLREFVGTIAQDALVPVQLTAGTFDELLQHVRTASLRAYRNSWFDPTDLWEVITAVGLERGVSWSRDCVFNDMSALVRGGRAAHERVYGGRYPALRTDSAEVSGGTTDDSSAELTWLPAEWMGTPFVLYLHQVEETLDLSIWAAPGAMSAADVTEFAHSMLRIIERVAAGNLSLDEVSQLDTVAPAVRGDGWLPIDSCWVEIAAVHRMLEGVLVGRPYHLSVEPDDALGHRLICHTVGDVDPVGLHAACVAALPGRPGAMAPHRYVVCATAPTDTGALSAWQAQPITADGSGRPGVDPAGVERPGSEVFGTAVMEPVR
jgi:hypothetical protein